MKVATEKCLKPCKGLYADIAVDNTDVRNIEEKRKFDKLFEHFEQYKRSYYKEITFPTSLEGRIEF